MTVMTAVGLGCARLRRVALAAAFLLPLTPHSSQAQTDKPDPKDAAVIIKCLRAGGVKGGDRQSCVGLVSTPCLQDDQANRTTVGMDKCGDREFFVWNDILEKVSQRIHKDLDAKQRKKLESIQKSWIAARNGSCGFYWDYFKGTMAGPLVAECMADETARRVLFLLGFVEDTKFLDSASAQ